MNHIDDSTASPPATLALNTADTDIIIAVMGTTGSGKSTVRSVFAVIAYLIILLVQFINLISGSKLHVGKGLRSCTSEVDATAPFIFQGRRVVMFDTPGFDDTTKTDTDILKLVATFLANTYKNGAKLAGVIYMHRINDTRMGGIAVRNFSMFRKLCGDKSLKNVAIVTNFWSEVDPAVGEERETELRSDDAFFKPVLDKQAKLLRHDGTLAAAHAIVAQIADNQPMALRIQEELVDEQKDISETAAVTELNRELEEQERKHAEELEQIKKDMEVAAKKRDEEKRQERETAERKLKEEKEREQMELQKLAAQRNEEKARLEQRMKELSEEAQRSAEAHQRQMREHREQQDRDNHHRHEMQRQVDEMNRRHEEERNRGGCIIA